MTKYVRGVFFFCLVFSHLTYLSAQSSKDLNGFKADSISHLLQGEWDLSTIQKPDNDVSDTAVPKGSVLINGDRFAFNIDEQGIIKQGSWSLNARRLEVFPDLGPDTAIIDSSVYMVTGGAPVLVLFEEGVKKAVIASGSIQTDQIPEQFILKRLSPSLLEFEYNKSKYVFLKVLPQEITTSVSLKPTTGLTAESGLRGMLGILTLVLIAVAFSENRKAINWPLVVKGLIFQFVFAVLVLKVPFVTSIFEVISGFFIKIISFTQAGTDFLFKSFVTNKIEIALINFVIQVLPTIVFFAALTSLLYYYGVLQKIVYVFAWLMKRIMNLSGAESLAAAGNIFLGQTESPLLIRPYLNTMTRSELLCLMSGGMATIAGGVLAAYIGFLGGGDPEQQLFYAKHLLAASVMSAPAAIVAAKILVPETEEFDKKMELPKGKLGSNALEAIANGTTDGIRLAVNVAAMLLVFIAFIAMANFFLEDVIGAYTGLNQKIASFNVGGYETFSLQFILGLLFAPLSWLMGVAKEDVILVGQLLGEKTILNEFVAYVSLGEMKDTGKFVEEKSIIMATYILCGFANFASIGIQIGGIGALVPDRKGVLSTLGVKALIGGTLASLFTAVLVGVIL